MRLNSIISLLTFLIFAGCVDRISFDVGQSAVFPIVVDGFISDQAGPYTIEITKAFDIESKLSLKTPISAKRVSISDDTGYSEELTQISQGIYRTNPSGIVGTIGRAYKLRVELLDGRVYESIPDTLKASGLVDSVYYDFETETNKDGVSSYGFDVFFDATSDKQGANYFLWKFIGTYQIETNPELYKVSCGESKCPSPLPCSAYTLNSKGQLQWVKECECCTCWVDYFNDVPIVSDDQFIEAGQFKSVKAGRVPVNQWTFMHKVHVEIQQRSLSRQAFDFWRAVKAQKRATTSLFQPISGKIKSNFVQISGQSVAMEGLFYATSISSKSIFITPQDLPNVGMIPPQDLPFENSCLLLFPNSTLQKPAYWD